MLILGRFSGQSILIGDSILITIIQVADGSVRVGITAPYEVDIVRTEVLERIIAAVIKLF